MTNKEFKNLQAGDRVQLGGLRGEVSGIHPGWNFVYVQFDNGDEDWVEYKFLDLVEKRPSIRKVSYEEGLKAINQFRTRIGQRELDVKSAGWGEEDVLTEYYRLVSDGSIKPL